MKTLSFEDGTRGKDEHYYPASNHGYCKKCTNFTYWLTNHGFCEYCETTPKRTPNSQKVVEDND